MDNTTVSEEHHPSLFARVARVGSVSGLIAGLGMGVILQFGTDLIPIFGGLLGRTSIVRGWLVHLLVSIVYGVVFAWVIDHPATRRMVPIDTFGEYVLAAVTYAVMIAAVTVTMLPFALETLPGTAEPWFPSGRVPGPGVGSLVGAMIFGVSHLVYGAVLGVVYGLLRNDPRVL